MFESFGYLDEVNSADTNCLPLHLKAKWLEVAVSNFKSLVSVLVFIIFYSSSPKGLELLAIITKKKVRRLVLYCKYNGILTCYPWRGPGFCVPNPSKIQNGQLTSRRRQSGSGKCLHCDELHQLWNCEQFKKK